ncbi:Uncharacterised protein [Bordetella pertussis]|nr:Uncharacterised protein [Bordetella pertussis]
MQRYMPGVEVSQYRPLKARSVPFCRATAYSSGASWVRHSASVLRIFSMISLESRRANWFGHNPAPC